MNSCQNDNSGSLDLCVQLFLVTLLIMIRQ